MSCGIQVDEKLLNETLSFNNQGWLTQTAFKVAKTLQKLNKKVAETFE